MARSKKLKLGVVSAPVWKAGKPISEGSLSGLGVAAIRARACREIPPHVFVNPDMVDLHALHRLGMERETCLQIPLRISRVETENGGTVFVESGNGVQMVESECLLTAELTPTKEPATATS